MKNLIFALSLLLTFSREASANIEKDCFNFSDEALICTYSGETGLELFPNIKLHNIHRIPVLLNSGYGSIVLIKNAFLDGLTFNECWSMSHRADRDLLLFCQREASYPGEVPKVILNEIKKLRAN